MANPLADLIALARVPATLTADLGVIANAMRSVLAIETMLISLMDTLDPLLADVERLRNTVEPQQQRVAHIEEMMQTLERRATVIESTLLRLAADAGEAIELLPEPDDNRGALTKAKNAITGS